MKDFKNSNNNKRYRFSLTNQLEKNVKSLYMECRKMPRAVKCFKKNKCLLIFNPFDLKEQKIAGLFT